MTDPRDRLFFFDAAPDACLVLGYSWRILDANMAFRQLTGWFPQELQSRPLHGLMPGLPSPADLASGLPSWDRVLEVSGPFVTRAGPAVPLALRLRGLPERSKVYAVCRPLPNFPAAAGSWDAPAPPPDPGILHPASLPPWARRQRAL